MFKLSTTLRGHDLDVRSVASLNDVSIVSGSRDGTARVWNASSGWNLDLPTDGVIAFQSPTNAFVNAVEYIDGEEPLIAAAGQEAIIYLTLPQDNFVKPGDDFGKYQLVGHSGNVCSLYYKEGVLISGSWDSTAKVWDLASLLTTHTLEGHQLSVWDVKIIDGNTFLTASADRTIRLWKGDKEIQRFVGHTDVVRKLLLLPGNKFASASNDGTIRIWSLSGEVLATLTGHTSFVYDLGLLSNGDLVSCGEDRTLRVWSLQTNEVLQAITLPCISVWCLAVLPNDDVVVGSSDNALRVFTRSAERVAPEWQLEEFAASVRESAIAEQGVDDLKRTDIPGYEALDSPGKQEGAVIMVKNPAGVIEAHQWLAGEWIKIGDVVGSAGGLDGKKEYNGKQYDYVFDVDVEDGKPALKLPYNSNESPYTAAERFLADNELPALYLQEVVQFIEKNTAGVSLEQTQEAVNPYADTRVTDPCADARPKAPSILPQKTLITYKDFVADRLIRGLTKFNGEEEHKFTESELASLQSILSSLNSKQALQIINEYVPRITANWTSAHQLVGYDLLRVAVPRVLTADLLRSLDAAENILKFITNGLGNVHGDAELPLLMMILKVLCNLVENTLFVQLYVTADETGALSYSDLFIELTTTIARLLQQYAATSSSHKLYNTLTTSVASFIYNLSAFAFINSGFRSSPPSSRPVAEFADAVAQPVTESYEEAAYRLYVAAGNLATLGTTKLPQWAKSLKYDSARFTELTKELANK